MSVRAGSIRRNGSRPESAPPRHPRGSPSHWRSVSTKRSMSFEPPPSRARNSPRVDRLGPSSNKRVSNCRCRFSSPSPCVDPFIHTLLRSVHCTTPPMPAALLTTSDRILRDLARCNPPRKEDGGPAAFAAGPPRRCRTCGTCYSLARTALAVAAWITPSSAAVFWPDSDGMPRTDSTSGSTRKERIPPQPFAPGAA